MPRQSRGFTLLELMVVIALVGVVLGVVSLATGSSPARVARQEAGQVLQGVEQFREQAVIEGREYGVRIQRDEYRVLRLEADGWQPTGTVHRLPQGLYLHLEQEGQRLNLDGTLPQLLMLSSDEVSAFVLSFKSAEQTWLSLVSDGAGDPWIEG